MVDSWSIGEFSNLKLVRLKSETIDDGSNEIQSRRSETPCGVRIKFKGETGSPVATGITMSYLSEFEIAFWGTLSK